MTPRLSLLCIAAVALVLVWGGAASPLAIGPFSAHMIVHVTVMALAAPLIAIALAGSDGDPTRRWPWLTSPMAAMLAELVVVWGWHLPLLHNAARSSGFALAAEQASFLAVGLALWLSVLGGKAAQRQARLAGGVVALLLTSMHMTLLGALITLAPRSLYHHDLGHRDLGHHDLGLHDMSSALADQQVAGMVMLSGSMSYLAGGLWLVARLLREDRRRVPLR